MATSCVEFLDKATFEYIQKYDYFDSQLKVVEQVYTIAILSQVRDILRSYSTIMGDLGEKVTADLSAKILHFEKTTFEKRQRGFDGVYRHEGKLVIVEAKMTMKPGPSALHRSRAKGYTQMSVQWLDDTALKMTNPNSAQYTENNRRLGEELLAQLKADRECTSIRRILVHVHPETKVTKVYEAHGNTDNWMEIDEYDLKQLEERLGYK